MGFYIGKIEDFQNVMEDLVNSRISNELEKLTLDLGNILTEKIRRKTPQAIYDDNGKKLDIKNNWEVSGVRKNGNEYCIEVSNRLDFAEKLEYGYKKREAVTGNLSFIPGQHMVKVSVDELDKELPEYISRMLDTIAYRL